MISPEVWNFKAPRHRIRNEVNESPEEIIRGHYFNHSVSVVLPNTSSIPESLCENIVEDTDYYQIHGLRAVELINKEFIQSFIKKGELSLLSIGKKIDTDNLLAVTSSGHLLLSLLRESYQKLGIEGKPTYFERKEHSRYVVTINLKDEELTPGKKFYERIHNSLDKLHDLTFTVIVSWDPPEEKVCPSSLAAWFNRLGYAISVCHQELTRRTEYTIEIPTFENGFKQDEFFEWLGVFSIGGNLINSDKEAKYVSSYSCPEPKLEVGQVQYLQLTGFLTRAKVQRIYTSMKDFAVCKGKSLPWGSMNVQGFADSPVSWRLKEHNFYVDGDNSYTIVFRPETNTHISQISLSSNNKPKITQ
ncbi:hypothetical protein QAD02_003933 [Eretmocerus hayati]|uniref:Uncharacterized protein n=1 Tax=Eretmocerus hayati TaxID=131215 RepID=A0ACC2NP79_9HYME|nr:hypothetical protein QAD02_003933 [Eretmocerus hayati]